VLSNPVEGREAEFNDWYTNIHLRDLLRVPGIVRAQRLKASKTQLSSEPQPWQYMAIYDCDAPSVQHIVDGISARAGTSEMTPSSAIANTRCVCFFEPITDVLQAAA
jgi:hypothetical protein